jgi:hypothetical protein
MPQANTNLEILAIKTTAQPGASIHRCIDDALRLAVTEWRTVELTHNGEVYIISLHDIGASIYEQHNP